MTLSIWNGNFMFSYDLEERPTQTEDSSWGRADLSSDTHTRPGQKQPRDVGAEGGLAAVISGPGRTEHKSGSPVVIRG